MTAMTTEFINRSTMYDEVKPYSPKSNHYVAKVNGKLGILDWLGSRQGPFYQRRFGLDDGGIPALFDL